MRTYGADASITRGSNTYGPNQYPEKLIPLFVTNALDGEPLPVYGDGRQIRDWLHVDDHCAGIELVLREGKPGEIYNVGGGNERREPRSHADDPRADRRRRLAREATSRIAPATTAATRSTRQAAQARLEAERTLADGLAETVAWYRENRAWWEPIKSGEYREYYEQQYAARLG